MQRRYRTVQREQANASADLVGNGNGGGNTNPDIEVVSPTDQLDVPCDQFRQSILTTAFRDKDQPSNTLCICLCLAMVRSKTPHLDRCSKKKG